MGAVFGLASVFGPAVGGYLTDQLSWRWIFYINLPFGILALAVLVLAMPRPEHGQEHRVDWWGAAALISGLVPLLLALNWGGSEYAWTSPTILALFAVAVVAIAVFVARELKASEPILDMRLFRDRSFSASMAVLFFSGVGMFGSIMFLPTFMQIVQNKTASSSGALLTPMMFAMIAGSISTGQLIARTGRYKVVGVVGLAVAATGMLALSRLTVDSSNLAVVLPMIAVGLGVGCTMPLFTISLQSQFPHRLGEVTGALQFFRSIGGTVGVALLGGVMNAHMRANLAERIGSKGVPALQLLWKGSAGQPGPFSAQGIKLILERFADKLPHGGEKFFTDFVAGLKVVTDGNIPRSFDPSGLLNVQMLDAVTKLVQGIEAKMPAAMAAQLGLGKAWSLLTLDLKSALTAGVTAAFLYGALMMALAFLAMFLVREVPLAGRPHLDSAAEIGAEILAEEAVLPSDQQPDVAGSARTSGGGGDASA
jgi:MFS family permease